MILLGHLTPSAVVIRLFVIVNVWSIYDGLSL